MKQIFIDTKERNHICIIENHLLTEYHIEERSSILGNIYRARVENVLKGMDSAFIDIGQGRNAYLNFKDGLSKDDYKLYKESKKNVSIRTGDEIIVQVIKEPFMEKGAKVTSRLSLAGRYIVLTPYNLGINISKKIKNKKEIKRLKSLGQVLTDNMGLIFRTAAYKVDQEKIEFEYNNLYNQFISIEKQRNFLPTPKLIHKDGGLIYKIIRDGLNEEFEVIVNSKEVEEEIIQIGEFLNFPLKKRVKFQKDFKLEYNQFLEKEIKEALSRRVNLKSGGYIVIDELEALTAIDVNTGKFTGNISLEETVVKTNLEAAEVIARQIKIRNLSGIIIVDFIDMKNKEDIDKVLSSLEKFFKNDKNKANIIGMTRLGLVEITRKRTSPSLKFQINRV